MERNIVLRGIVCVAICLIAAPCLAQSTGMVGPEMRQWIEDPTQGLAALRDGRIADLPKAPEAMDKDLPSAPAVAVSEKAVEILFADAGMEAAVRAQLNRPTGPIYDTDVEGIGELLAQGYGIQTLADLQQMPNLYYIQLQDNDISTLAGFPEYSQLYLLNLDRNLLTSFEGLPSLPSLRLLSAQRNQIDTLADLPDLPSLWELYLQNNQISSLAGMPALTNVYRVDLSHNRLSGVANLPGRYLDYLNLSHNALQSLEGMPRIEGLSSLDISFNQLTTVAGLYKDSRVYYLRADHNQLESLGVLGQLDQLVSLTVGDNRLTDLSGAHFSTDLRELDVSRNRLSTLAGVDNYPNLDRLNASGNCLKSLKSLAGLNRLSWLSLAGNGLNSLAGLPAMPALYSLDVSCNQLTALTGMGETLNLVNLEARFNQLQTLDAGFRPGLGYLGVSSNGLTSLSTLNGANTPWLYMIDVSFNQLTSLQGVEAAPSLSAIAARGNQLASLADLAGNPRLDWLDVSSNQLTSFDDLPPNPPLAWLNASRNQIASLSGLAVAANLYLTRLDVSRNLLASVAEIASADRLYNLDIADNQVSDLAPLQGRMWQELGLANNPTGDVQSVLFQGNGMPGVVSVGPGQLPNLTVCSEKLFGTWMFSANGPEYGNLNGLRWFRFKQLRVSGAGISSLTALADAAAIYGSSVSRLALPGNMFSDLSPLGGVPMTWLDVSENAVEDISSVTSEHLASQFNPPTHGLQLLNLSANPVESLAPALGQTMYQEHFPPIGAIIFAEYELEQFGMTPEQAHNCLTFDAVVDVTDTPVAAAPEVGQLRAEGVKVRTEGTCSYCAGACVPPVQVAAPEVTGLTQEAAAAALEAARLTVGTVTLQCSDAVAAGLVISQDPAVGTIMDEGSGVALVVSLGPCTVPVTVPDVVGQPVSEAVATVQAAGLLIGTLTQSHSDTVPAGSVVRQNPAAGASVPPDTAVALVISLGASPAEGEGEPQVPLEERAQALLDGFCAADSDGNRHLSLAEAQAAQPGLTEDEFALLDANGDGELSKHELDEYLEGPCGCRGCHGGAPEWDRRLGEFSLLFLAMIGFGVIGQAARP